MPGRALSASGRNPHIVFLRDGAHPVSGVADQSGGEQAWRGARPIGRAGACVTHRQAITDNPLRAGGALSARMRSFGAGAAISKSARAVRTHDSRQPASYGRRSLRVEVPRQLEGEERIAAGVMVQCPGIDSLRHRLDERVDLAHVQPRRGGRGRRSARACLWHPRRRSPARR